MGVSVRWMATGESVTVCDCVIEVIAIRGREVRLKIIEPDGTVKEVNLTDTPPKR